jgi:hypothetical protein
LEDYTFTIYVNAHTARIKDIPNLVENIDFNSMRSIDKVTHLQNVSDYKGKDEKILELIKELR